MHALATPGAATTSAPPPSRTPAATQQPRRWGWVGRGVRLVTIAAAATAAIVLNTAVNRPAVTLTWADGIDLGPGISVTPAPGWAVGNQGPGWVTLHNAFSTAEMEIKVKPSSGGDPVAVLQNDISHLSNVSTTGLTNVRDLSAPTAIPLGPGNFQRQATVSYNADGTSVTGPLPVQGWFVELLNPSTHQSAFVVFTQNGDAPVRADGDAQAMLDSMQ
jgi:hypothetical protein